MVLFLPYLACQDINKRLSLPADIRLPEGYLEKLTLNSPIFDKPLSRRLRRVSLVSVFSSYLLLFLLPVPSPELTSACLLCPTV